EALRNYLCLMGWSHPHEKDVFNLNEFIEQMSLERIQTSGPIFDLNKLNWMNGKYIREVLSLDEVVERLQPFLPADFPKNLLPKMLPLVRDRLVTLKDIGPLTEFFYHDIEVHKEDLVGKKGTADEAKMYLDESIKKFEVATKWKALPMETVLRDMCDAKGWNRGAFFMTLRVAVTGRTTTPPLFDTIEVLGKETTMKRLNQACALFT
ncbi:MAG: glutamate--tRNA ligase, partial [Patescibacteria group bacterium]